VVENENKELVQTRLPMKIWVCIDYRKLNVETRKDHFPLLFIDQLLERLAGHEYYYFLDNYPGYNQIPIAPEDQEKIHISIWDICWSSNAFHLVQCPNNVSTLHVKSFLWYGRTILRNLHGWFLYLRRFIHSMSSPSRTYPLTLCWEEYDT